MPAQAVRGDLPVVRQIADRHIVAFVEARQPGIDLSGQMLLGAAGEKAGTQRLQRAIVRNTQRGGIVLPLTAEEGMEQGFQLHRGKAAPAPARFVADRCSAPAPSSRCADFPGFCEIRAVRVCRARSWPASLATRPPAPDAAEYGRGARCKTALRQFADGDLLRRPG